MQAPCVQLSDGTMLLRTRTGSVESGRLPRAQSIRISDVSFYTNGVHATFTRSRSLQPSRSLPYLAEGLQHDRSVADSERLPLSSSNTLGSSELSGVFYRGNSIRSRPPA